MKPRLESAPLTKEDESIWRFLCCFYWHERYNSSYCAESHARDSDRRDADLMLEQQFMRYILVYREEIRDGLPCGFRVVHVHPLKGNKMHATREFHGIEWP